MTIRVMVADDQALIRVAYRAIIDSEPDFEVVAEASNGREAVELARRVPADVALVDIRMPELDGLAATELITADPQLADLRVLIIPTFDMDEYVFRALQAGASGFVGKGVEPDELVEAIRVVHRGDALLSPAATNALVARYLAGAGRHETLSLSELTTREREVLGLVASGMANSEIATHLVISENTAKTHVKRIMGKLGAHDRAQLVVIAYESGLVQTSR